ncbi:MAG: hypothetical protein AMXMBFR53_40390 [Gemmatimonadota bacterium]
MRVSGDEGGGGSPSHPREGLGFRASRGKQMIIERGKALFGDLAGSTFRASTTRPPASDKDR